MLPDTGSPLIIRSFCTSSFEVNTYLLHTPDDPSAWVIDPGLAFDAVNEYLSRHNLKLRSILLTHGHIDHVMDAGRLAGTHRAPLLMHTADQYLIDDLPFWADYFKLPLPALPTITGTLDDGLAITLSTDTVLKVRHTPGHSPGSACLYSTGHLLTGDTLFAGGVGRTDLPGGNSDQLNKSLHTILNEYPPDTVIYPGHGPTSTLRQEAETNYFLTPTTP